MSLGIFQHVKVPLCESLSASLCQWLSLSSLLARALATFLSGKLALQSFAGHDKPFVLALNFKRSQNPCLQLREADTLVAVSEQLSIVTLEGGRWWQALEQICWASQMPLGQAMLVRVGNFSGTDVSAIRYQK